MANSLEIDQFMRQYAKIFLEYLPDPTIQLLIELCTGELNPTKSDTNTATTTVNGNGTSSPEKSDEPQGAAGFNLSTAYNETMSGTPHGSVRGRSNGRSPMSQMPTLPVHAPSPRQFFGAFAGNNDALVKFLEGVAARRWPVRW